MTQDQANFVGRPGATAGKVRPRFCEAGAVAGLVLAGWCLTGLALVPFESRAVYERFGAPVAVLGPGLHGILPWPFSHLRRLACGAVHSVPLAGQPGVSVLYRVGLTDAQALDAAYGSTDPDRLVQAIGSEILASGGSADFRALRADIQAELDRAGSGLDVLGVVAAPHVADEADTVGAATIAAETILAEARGKADIDRAESRRVSADQVEAARAKAAETVASARSLLVAFTADQAANKASSKSFLLERYFANLSRAIATSPKTIIDHRLNWPAAPELDLRPPLGLPSGGGKGK